MINFLFTVDEKYPEENTTYLSSLSNTYISHNYLRWHMNDNMYTQIKWQLHT